MTKAIWIWTTLSLACPVAANAEEQFFKFEPHVAAGSGLSPEACHNDPGLARGSLGGPGAYGDQGECHSGLVGFTAGAEAGDTKQHVDAWNEFFTEELADGFRLAGSGRVRVHYIDPTPPADGEVASLGYELAEVTADGSVTVIASGIAIEELRDDAAAGYAGQVGSLDIGAYRVAAGSVLRLRLTGTHESSADARLLYGGVTAPSSTPAVGLIVPPKDFGDSGLTLGVGAAPVEDAGEEPAPVDPPVDPPADPQPEDPGDPLPENPADPQPSAEPEDEPSTRSRSKSGGGSLPFTTLAVLLFAGVRRRRVQADCP